MLIIYHISSVTRKWLKKFFYQWLKIKRLPDIYLNPITNNVVTIYTTTGATYIYLLYIFNLLTISTITVIKIGCKI